MTLDPTTLLGRSLGHYTLDRLLGGCVRLGVRRPPRGRAGRGPQGAETPLRCRPVLRGDIRAGGPNHGGPAPPQHRADSRGRRGPRFHVLRHGPVPGYAGSSTRTGGPLDEPALVRVGTDIAAALGFAHERDVVHRDVNGRNILLRADGTAVIADFGIAYPVSTAEPHARAPMTIGTQQYMSPEHAQGALSTAAVTSTPSASCCTRPLPDPPLSRHRLVRIGPYARGRPPTQAAEAAPRPLAPTRASHPPLPGQRAGRPLSQRRHPP